MELLHTGKVKRVFRDPENDGRVIIEFTDAITAGDGEKKDEFTQKGELTCDITQFFMKYLEKKGIRTHLITRLDGPRLRCHRVEIFPIEVVCRNIAAGSFCRRYGVESGTELPSPLIELFLKDDKLNDPLISKDAALAIELATEDEINFMKSLARSVNYYLAELLAQIDLKLIDFKLEFGIDPSGNILLADEISGDTMRVWDKGNVSLDKDLFRKSSGDVIEAYSELLNRLKETKPEEIAPREEAIFVSILPKDGIKNPPGEVTKKALNRLGFIVAKDVRMGKIFAISLNRPITTEILKQLELMNLKLLSNPIAEKRSVRLE